ncbi:ComEA family DNA-binding protein [Streptomyces sp. NPDC018036]|uniref:ComEA family DNA-binding protein n=1 Tax=Streptomyces sp. NPDC018036 TaxID=3365035 RepID=UPI00378F0249
MTGREGRIRTRRQQEASAAALRLRADALFPEHAQERRESGSGPPGGGALAVGTTPDSELDLHGPVPHGPVLPGPDSYELVPHGPDLHEAVPHGPDPHGPDLHEPVAYEPAEESGGWRDRAGLAVRERLPVWLQSRCGLERRSVVALTVLLAVAAVFAVQHFWAGRTRPVRAPEVVGAAAPFGGKRTPGEGPGGGSGERPGAESGGPTGAPGAGGAGGGMVVVDVGGKVRAPGLRRLPAGSRVEDALRAAGGPRPGTDTDGLNRARLLVDGEQIMVGASMPPAGAGSDGSVGSGPLGAGGSGAGAPPAAPIPLNTATVEQFDSLPGVGPVLARHIIDYRTAHGGFRSVDELREVNGIGDRRFADLRNLVRP